jgi:uncharacterized protein (TIGR00266 family)
MNQDSKGDIAMRYTIEGTPMPVLICTLSQGEQVITEKGGMSWMTPNMKMETNMRGGLGKALGRMFSGESAFMSTYTCTSGEGMIAFASSMPGSILPFEISPGAPIIAQKSAFLAADATVELSVSFNRKFGGGLVGGEGFVMQKLSGHGMAFLEVDGHCVEYTLGAGEKLIVDTGNVAALSASVSLDVQTVKGLTNTLFGGEGFFNTVLTGPGKVYLQTMPVKSLAQQILPFLPSTNK